MFPGHPRQAALGGTLTLTRPGDGALPGRVRTTPVTSLNPVPIMKTHTRFFSSQGLQVAWEASLSRWVGSRRSVTHALLPVTKRALKYMRTHVHGDGHTGKQMRKYSREGALICSASACGRRPLQALMAILRAQDHPFRPTHENSRISEVNLRESEPQSRASKTSCPDAGDAGACVGLRFSCLWGLESGRYRGKAVLISVYTQHNPPSTSSTADLERRGLELPGSVEFFQ